MKSNCYVCVDGDGTEKIREKKLKRFYGTAEELQHARICYDDLNKKNIWITDYDHISDDDFPKLGMYTNIIILPKGTIKKIIGRDLTWEDDAVELT